MDAADATPPALKATRKTPAYYDEAPALAREHPLAKALCSAQGGVIDYRYIAAVSLAGHACPSVAGGGASVAGLVTGPANAGGFKGLAGRFGRRDLLRFGVLMSGDIRFTRVDSGLSVEFARRGFSAPRPATVSQLLRGALDPQASEDARRDFAQAWGEWITQVIDPSGAAEWVEITA